MWRWDVKMRRFEDEQMWRCEDVKMRKREDLKMWRCDTTVRNQILSPLFLPQNGAHTPSMSTKWVGDGYYDSTVSTTLLPAA